ncbi:MAG: hypothetical protein B2I17_02145 [Thermoplasmatales archaeon B_DKE]|nr:MAG: hypothetical protein B2I17_02145 [Thermoplasmatales archaeon B_DKE]
MKVTRKPRIAGSVKSRILDHSEENTTYRNWRIWALLRNSGIRVSIKDCFSKRLISYELSRSCVA